MARLKWLVMILSCCATLTNEPIILANGRFEANIPTVHFKLVWTCTYIQYIHNGKTNKKDKENKTAARCFITLQICSLGFHWISLSPSNSTALPLGENVLESVLRCPDAPSQNNSVKIMIFLWAMGPQELFCTDSYTHKAFIFTIGYWRTDFSSHKSLHHDRLGSVWDCSTLQSLQCLLLITPLCFKSTRFYHEVQGRQWL